MDAGYPPFFNFTVVKVKNALSSARFQGFEDIIERHLFAKSSAKVVSSPARFLSIEDFFIDQDNDDEFRFDISNEDLSIA